MIVFTSKFGSDNIYIYIFCVYSCRCLPWHNSTTSCSYQWLSFIHRLCS